ncbi:MAG: Holliday junction resolvase RuvX [Bacillota bacterium]|nr:Holliday junction resolvase RuvX [Bacillota bacterium]
MTEQPGRWLGLDFGLARIGVAISDPLGITARGIETLRWNGRDAEPALLRLLELLDEHQIAGIVLGQPRRTDGRASASEAEAEGFAAALAERCQLPIVRVDERFTTVLAHRLLSELDWRGDRRRVIDQVAAEIILQDYLDRRARAARAPLNGASEPDFGCTCQE